MRHVCCSVLQCVAVCCRVMSGVGEWCWRRHERCSVLRCVAGCCSVMHGVAGVAVYCKVWATG